MRLVQIGCFWVAFRVQNLQNALRVDVLFAVIGALLRQNLHQTQLGEVELPQMLHFFQRAVLLRNAALQLPDAMMSRAAVRAGIRAVRNS